MLQINKLKDAIGLLAAIVSVGGGIGWAYKKYRRHLQNQAPLCKPSSPSTPAGAEHLEQLLYRMLDPLSSEPSFWPFPLRLWTDGSEEVLEGRANEVIEGLCVEVEERATAGWAFGDSTSEDHSALRCALEKERINIFASLGERLKKGSGAANLWRSPVEECNLSGNGRDNAVVFLEITAPAGQGKSKLLGEVYRKLCTDKRREFCDLSQRPLASLPAERIMAVLRSSKPLVFLLDEAGAQREEIEKFLGDYAGIFRSRKSPTIFVFAARQGLLRNLQVPINLPVLNFYAELMIDEERIKGLFGDAFTIFYLIKHNINNINMKNLEIQAKNLKYKIQKILPFEIITNSRSAVLAAWYVVREDKKIIDIDINNIFKQLNKVERERWIKLGATTPEKQLAARDLIALAMLGVFEQVDERDGGALHKVLRVASDHLGWQAMDWLYKAPEKLGLFELGRVLPMFLAEWFTVDALQEHAEELVEVALLAHYELPGKGKPGEQATRLFSAYEVLRLRLTWLLDRWPGKVGKSRETLLAHAFSRVLDTIKRTISCDETTREELEALCALIQAEEAEDPKKRAELYEQAGKKLRSWKYPELSLVAWQKVVNIWRVIVEQNPDRFLPDLAASLNNLGNQFSNLGRHQEALQATQEAVQLYRQLAQQNPAAFLPDLAMSLNNLGAMLSSLGSREEALEATQEAVQIRRQLARQNPDAFLPGLARSLNNLGNWLSDLGRHPEALEATQEAVQIRRQLARQNPDAFLPDLAASLNNLGSDLSSLGSREEALEATQEAVQLYRQLAQQNPDRFLPDLARSLNNLGNRFSNLGRHPEALEATQEAVQLYRQLAQQNPDAFLPDLATSLNNLGVMLSNLGRHQEALQATQEAVQIRRQLARQNPDAFLPDLAMSLDNLGAMLSNLGRHQEALQATQEAVQLYRQLARQNPDAFLPDLAASLNNLGAMLSNLGRHQEALQAVEEAARALWPYFKRYPKAHGNLWGQLVKKIHDFAVAGLPISDDVAKKVGIK